MTGVQKCALPILFPATLNHDTIGHDELSTNKIEGINDVENRRISIAGDIILTYKEKIAKHLGLQPIKNWRMFEK